MNLEEARYRVVLIAIGDDDATQRESFCKDVSEKYGFSESLLEKIVGRCPVVLKKNLSLKRAEALAKILRSFGAVVSVEKRRDLPVISLEFQELSPHRLALESSFLQRTQSGSSNVIGRAKNISGESLNDAWVLIEFFGDPQEFLGFEEVPIPINPLPPGENAPFKVIFEGDIPVKRASIAFKNSSGNPIPAVDRRRKKEWVPVEIKEGKERPSRPVFLEKEGEGRPEWIDIAKPSREVLIGKSLAAQGDVLGIYEPEVAPPSPEEKRETEEGKMEERLEARSISSSERALPEVVLDASILRKGEERVEPIGVAGSHEAVFKEDQKEITAGDLETLETAVFRVPEKDEGIERGIEGEIGRETSLLRHEAVPLEIEPETAKEIFDLTLKPTEEDESQVRIVLKAPLEKDPAEAISLPVLEERKADEEGALPEVKDGPEDQREISEEARTDTLGLLEPTRLLEEISGKVEEGAGKEPVPFPWIEDFRNAVDHYHEKTRDLFSIWFDSHRKENGFSDPLNSLPTILVHSRFDQMSQPEKALENTQKVFRLIVQPNLQMEEIPPLWGTEFHSGEQWQELFHRAIFRIQQVVKNILGRRRWSALDLERLIQVIPHMSDRNSRRAVRWIDELIPEIVEIDFSNTSVAVGENLYRVGSRLGVVDPHFDCYQGKDSMGDLKIQFFAKAAFPQNPMKIVEPMNWVGMEEKDGGHCFSTQPRCPACIFETFCPKLYLHFDPALKGMQA